MFEDAASVHFHCSCNVGTGYSRDESAVVGMGCALGNDHVLTANHCLPDQGDGWPMVVRRDGAFRAEIVFQSTAYDIAVLRITERINDRSIGEIEVVPSVSSQKLNIGANVGFVSQLVLSGAATGRRRHTHFAVGVISTFINGPEDSFRFVLSSTVIQKGFSGSAVFGPDGDVVGVVTEMLRFQADREDRTSPVYTLPVISPLYSLSGELKILLAT